MINPESNLASAYSELLDALADSSDLDAFLDQAVALAARVVSPTAACGLTMRRDGHPYTVANSASFAAQVDEIQYGAAEGPCLETLRTGRAVRVDDLASDGRWPRYRAHAIAHGVGSSVSLPLTVDGQTIAALNLYSDQPGAFDDDSERHAAAFAAQFAAALKLVLRQADQNRVQNQLGEALVSRSVIDQALGIIMGQQRCTADEAFEMLRQASQHRNRKLRDVATDMIIVVTGSPPGPPTDFRS